MTYNSLGKFSLIAYAVLLLPPYYSYPLSLELHLQVCKNFFCVLNGDIFIMASWKLFAPTLNTEGRLKHSLTQVWAEHHVMISWNIGI